MSALDSLYVLRCFFALEFFHFVELYLELLYGRVLILVLRTLALALNYNTTRLMGQSYRRIGFIDVCWPPAPLER